MKTLLANVPVGKKCKITFINKNTSRKRLLEIGLHIGAEIEVLRRSPFKDPTQYRIGDFLVSLRKVEALNIEVELLEESFMAEFNN